VATDQVILAPTIEQLRAYCPFFGGRVAGAADFIRGLQNYNATMPLPAAYVIPLDQESTGNKLMVGLEQIISKVIGVVVELDAADRRGQVPAMQCDEIEAALFAAILNWAPVECRVPGKSGYVFSAGRFLDLDRARLFYRWEFLLEYQISDEDGWHPPASDAEDLLGIELDIYKAPPFEMPPPDARPPAAIVIIPTSDQPVTPVEVTPVEDTP
jgi:hypothetical protein